MCCLLSKVDEDIEDAPSTSLKPFVKIGEMYFHFPPERKGYFLRSLPDKNYSTEDVTEEIPKEGLEKETKNHYKIVERFCENCHGRYMATLHLIERSKSNLDYITGHKKTKSKKPTKSHRRPISSVDITHKEKSCDHNKIFYSDEIDKNWDGDLNVDIIENCDEEVHYNKNMLQKTTKENVKIKTANESSFKLLNSEENNKNYLKKEEINQSELYVLEVQGESLFEENKPEMDEGNQKRSDKDQKETPSPANKRNPNEKVTAKELSDVEMRPYKKRSYHQYLQNNENNFVETMSENGDVMESRQSSSPSSTEDNEKEKDGQIKGRKGWKKKISRKQFRHHNIKLFTPEEYRTSCLLKQNDSLSATRIRVESMPKEAITESIVNSLGGQKPLPDTKTNKKVSFSDCADSTTNTEENNNNNQQINNNPPGKHNLPAIITETPSVRRKSIDNITTAKILKPTDLSTRRSGNNKLIRRMSTDTSLLSELKKATIHAEPKSILKRRITVAEVPRCNKEQEQNLRHQIYSVSIDNSSEVENLSRTRRYSLDTPVDLSNKGNQEADYAQQSYLSVSAISASNALDTSSNSNTYQPSVINSIPINYNTSNEPTIQNPNRMQRILLVDPTKRKNSMCVTAQELSSNYCNNLTGANHIDIKAKLYIDMIKTLMIKEFSLPLLEPLVHAYNELETLVNDSGISNTAKKITEKVLDDVFRYIAQKLQYVNVSPQLNILGDSRSSLEKNVFDNYLEKVQYSKILTSNSRPLINELPLTHEIVNNYGGQTINHPASLFYNNITPYNQSQQRRDNPPSRVGIQSPNGKSHRHYQTTGANLSATNNIFNQIPVKTQIEQNEVTQKSSRLQRKHTLQIHSTLKQIPSNNYHRSLSPNHITTFLEQNPTERSSISHSNETTYSLRTPPSVYSRVNYEPRIMPLPNTCLEKIRDNLPNSKLAATRFPFSPFVQPDYSNDVFYENRAHLAKGVQVPVNRHPGYPTTVPSPLPNIHNLEISDAVRCMEAQTPQTPQSYNNDSSVYHRDNSDGRPMPQMLENSSASKTPPINNTLQKQVSSTREYLKMSNQKPMTPTHVGERNVTISAKNPKISEKMHIIPAVIVADNSMQITKETVEPNDKKKREASTSFMENDVHMTVFKKGQDSQYKSISKESESRVTQAQKNEDETEFLNLLKLLKSKIPDEKLKSLIFSEMGIVKKEEPFFLESGDPIEIEDSDDEQPQNTPVRRISEVSPKKSNINQDKEEVQQSSYIKVKDCLKRTHSSIDNLDTGKSPPGAGISTIHKTTGSKASLVKSISPISIPYRDSSGNEAMEHSSVVMYRSNNVIYSPEIEPISPVGNESSFVYPDVYKLSRPSQRINKKVLPSLNISTERGMLPDSVTSPSYLTPTPKRKSPPVSYSDYSNDDLITTTTTTSPGYPSDSASKRRKSLDRPLASCSPLVPPSGKLCYIRENNTFLRYFDDTQVELFIRNLSYRDDELLRSTGIDPEKMKKSQPGNHFVGLELSKTEIIRLPTGVEFSTKEELPDVEEFVKESNLVEQYVPKDFANFYRFVTGYQIIRHNHPVSLQTFLTMYNTNRTKELLVKYLQRIGEEDEIPVSKLLDVRNTKTKLLVEF